MIGPLVAEYALSVAPIDPYRMAEDVLAELTTVASFGGGTRPRRGSALELLGAEITSVRRHRGALEVRLFNPTDEAVSVSLPNRSGDQVDLRGEVLAAWSGSVELGPHAITTLRLTEG